MAFHSVKRKERGDDSMKCEECRELLWIYLEWKTSPEESAEIKAHLAGCPECRRTAAAQMGILETVRSLPEVEPPEGWHAELMQKIAAEQAAAAEGFAEEKTEPAEPVKVIPIQMPTEKECLPAQEPEQEEQEEIWEEPPRRHKWRQWGLVAAAALLVGAAGGIARLQMEQPEPMQLTAEVTDAGEKDGMLRNMALDIPEDMAPDAPEDMALDMLPDEEVWPDAAEGEKQLAGGAGLDAEPEMAMGSQKMAEPESVPAPVALRAAPVPEAAPQTASAGGAAHTRASAELAADSGEAAEGAAESDTETQPMAASDTGDRVTLRMEHGGNARSFIARAVERTAGFEESADSGIQVMIPVENVGAFYEELGKFGEVEWQAQGQEEAGAMYRRVRIQVETE